MIVALTARPRVTGGPSLRTAAVCACLSLVLLACGAAPTGPAADIAPLSFVLHEQRFESRGCARSGQPCAQVLLRWPEFSDLRQADAIEPMQAWILDHLGRHSETGEATESPEAAARAFIASFERQLDDTPALSQDWFEHRRVQVIHQDAQVISLALDISSYTGGAHPMSARRLASFDRDSGELLTLDAVVRPAARGLFTDLVTRSVRSELGIAPELNLADAGFLVEDNRITPTDNFVVTARGWLMHYDPYEIAPYAMGPIEIELSFSELENIAAPGTPAAPRTPPLIADPP